MVKITISIVLIENDNAFFIITLLTILYNKFMKNSIIKNKLTIKL